MKKWLQMAARYPRAFFSELSTQYAEWNCMFLFYVLGQALLSISSKNRKIETIIHADRVLCIQYSITYMLKTHCPKEDVCE